MEKQSYLQNNITYIVTGLPRSGTSLMMQILEKIGIEIYFDREFDERNWDMGEYHPNPNGFYELIRKNRGLKDILANTKNKAVKILLPELKKLPIDREFKVILMNRNKEEVRQSQEAFFKKHSTPIQWQLKMEKSTKRMIKILFRKDNIDVLKINYIDLLKNTNTIVKALSSFLNIKIDINGITDIIDINLYRFRKKNLIKNI